MIAIRTIKLIDGAIIKNGWGLEADRTELEAVKLMPANMVYCQIRKFLILVSYQRSSLQKKVMI